MLFKNTPAYEAALANLRSAEERLRIAEAALAALKK